MRMAGVEPKRMRIVHSHGVSRGEFVLVEGVKNGREELEVLPPLTVYSEDGQYTEAMNSVFRELSYFAESLRRMIFFVITLLRISFNSGSSTEEMLFSINFLSLSFRG